MYHKCHYVSVCSSNSYEIPFTITSNAPEPKIGKSWMCNDHPERKTFFWPEIRARVAWRWQCEWKWKKGEKLKDISGPSNLKYAFLRE